MFVVFEREREREREKEKKSEKKSKKEISNSNRACKYTNSWLLSSQSIRDGSIYIRRSLRVQYGKQSNILSPPCSTLSMEQSPWTEGNLGKKIRKYKELK